MQFTRQQIDDKFSDFYIDDFPGDWKNNYWRFLLFNSLPDDLQGLALQHGCMDTEFRDEVFVYLIKKEYQMTVEEYYKRVP